LVTFVPKIIIIEPCLSRL